MGKIRAAITAGIRPCAMVFHEQPTEEWKTLDFQLLEAYQILNDEVCPLCGHPLWLCRSKADTIEWVVKDSTCYATRAKEQKQASRSKEKVDRKTKAGWGRIDYVVPQVPSYYSEDTELPTREDFYSGGRS